MIRKTMIALTTLAAVGLDPLLARIEGRWQKLGRRRRQNLGPKAQR
jgi:hypothetical protein